MLPLKDQLAAIRAEAEAIFKSQGANKGNFEFIQQKLAATEDPAERLELVQAMERLLDLRDQGLTIQKQIRDEEQKSADIAAQAAQEKEAAAQKELEAARELARIELDRTRARASFDAETEALRLEASGRKEMADALRQETRIREESLGLAKQLGITEEAAVQLLRERANLQAQINGMDAQANAQGGIRKAEGQRGLGDARRLDGRESSIRKSDRNRNLRESFEERDKRLAEEARQAQLLKDAALDGRANNRKANEAGKAATDAAREAKAFWQKQLGLQERLVKHFDRLNTV
jgi:hypothetical protein